VNAGCSVLLDPERHDDVARCDFDDDCPPTEDPRYELYCTVSEDYEDQTLDFSRICAPRTAVSCNPRDYPFGSPIAMRHREAIGQLDRYEDRCLDHPGSQGCTPSESDCAPGLVPLDASGRCDDQDPQTPPAIAVQPEVEGQDVLDQFCRAVYCNIEFACNTRDFLCEPCTLGKSLGAGGCGDLYIAGEHSTAYQTAAQLTDECMGPGIDLDMAYVGPVDPD